MEAADARQRKLDARRGCDPRYGHLPAAHSPEDHRPQMVFVVQGNPMFGAHRTLSEPLAPQKGDLQTR